MELLDSYFNKINRIINLISFENCGASSNVQTNDLPARYILLLCLQVCLMSQSWDNVADHVFNNSIYLLTNIAH